MASILCSIKQLNAAAAPDANAMPTVVASNKGHGTIPGVARNMPISAVKTISEVTLGLHREKKFLKLKPSSRMVWVVALVIFDSHYHFSGQSLII